MCQLKNNTAENRTFRKNINRMETPVIVGLSVIFLIFMYFSVRMLIFTYRSNKELKSFQEYSKEQTPTFLSLSGTLSKTSHERYVAENSQRLANGFYRMTVFRTP
ncbi:hypothetical protein [Flavobacterium psychrophilum]|uniref:hypothetical protein n=1 Tax=Flavobacterium psychrophilum TaxID=96345 RepID=UPI0013FDFEC3|nr:hypothetical protein [Flavobacterium psychrophilum]